MFAYARAAIDFWSGWLAENQYLEQLKNVYGPNDAAHAAAQYENLKRSAFALAAKVGWEGDMLHDRCGPTKYA
jgi:hypothetical protein